MKILQYHPPLPVGGELTRSILALRDLLKSHGEVHLMADAAHPDLAIDRLVPHDGPALRFVHHLVEDDRLPELLDAPGPKVLVVHEALSPELTETSEGLRTLVAGRRQLARLRPYVDAAVAGSNYLRRELLRLGYRVVAVLPDTTYASTLQDARADGAIARKLKGRTPILSAGRLAPNQGLEAVIRAFAHYRHHRDTQATLILAGAAPQKSYLNKLKSLARELSLADDVMLLSEPTPSQLKAAYEGARLFLSLKPLEGPRPELLDAMRFGLPTLAFGAPGVAEIMAGAGILLDTRMPVEVGELIDLVLTDTPLQEKLRERQHRRVRELLSVDGARVVAQVLARLEAPAEPLTLQVDGSFETSYSLDIVNRYLAEAMARRDDLDVSIRATHGYGDYVPQAKDLGDKPEAVRLWKKSAAAPYPDVVVRNLYPPRVEDMRAGLNLFGTWGWEESRVPARIVNAFNRHLDGVAVTSTFVKEALERSGCRIPVAVPWNGVTLPDDFAALEPYPIASSKPFRFMHISSAFPRKGVDILLSAYFEAFTGSDPVVLVIKTFPNPHNTVPEQLETLREGHPNPPHVELINIDLPAMDLFRLYKSASCLVHVARGEGFGLPVAEAMLAKVPVIVSPNTGMADFCSDETAVCIPFTMVPARSHVSEEGALWAEPDRAALVTAMRQVAFQPETLRLSDRVEAAHHLISTEFTWERSAERYGDFIDTLRRRPRKPRVAFVSTWAFRCGIAEYSQFLISATRDRIDYRIYANDEARVLRVPDLPVYPIWRHHRAGDLAAMAERLIGSEEEVVHIQYHFGFFPLMELGAFIREVSPFKPVILTLHTTKDVHPSGGGVVSFRQIKDDLLRAAAIIVHQEEDRERLESFGIRGNIRVIPHGNVIYPEVTPEEGRRRLGLSRGPVLGTFGFLMPHKGTKEIIQAVGLLKAQYPDIHFLAPSAIHTNPDSAPYFQECQAEIKRLKLDANVTLIPDFLEVEESLAILQAADITLLPYHYTQESASGAVRFCMAALRPLITTQQPIFKELTPYSHQVAQPTPEALAEAVRHLLHHPEEGVRLVDAARGLLDETSWEAVGAQYVTLIDEFLTPALERRIAHEPPEAATPNHPSESDRSSIS